MLLWLLVRSTGVRAEDLKQACLHLRPIPLLAILAAIAVSIAAGAEKWRLVQNRFSPKPVGRGRAVALSAMGSAAGQFLPAPIASALARGGGTHVLEGAGGRRGALSSVWEQLFDILVIGLFTVPALLALRFDDVRWFLVGVPPIAITGDWLAGPATL
ncbi:MAG: lysylphosphatidylglycerol synthase domain-containing protein, partial [Caulobacteraceae bacterium]